jgi:hypothetical protein
MMVDQQHPHVSLSILNECDLSLSLSLSLFLFLSSSTLLLTGHSYPFLSLPLVAAPVRSTLTFIRSSRFTVLDANITVRVKWGNLQYGVPPNNILHLHVDTGRVNATCVNLNNLAAGCRRAFEFHFENINGHGAVDYDFDKNALALMVHRDEWTQLGMSPLPASIDSVMAGDVV